MIRQINKPNNLRTAKSVWKLLKYSININCIIPLIQGKQTTITVIYQIGKNNHWKLNQSYHLKIASLKDLTDKTETKVLQTNSKYKQEHVNQLILIAMCVINIING